MLWLVVVGMVALGAMAARDQFHAEDEKASMRQLSREYSL